MGVGGGLMFFVFFVGFVIVLFVDVMVVMLGWLSVDDDDECLWDDFVWWCDESLEVCVVLWMVVMCVWFWWWCWCEVMWCWVVLGVFCG